MQIQISQNAWDLLQKQQTRDGIASPEEALERVIHFYESHHSAEESLVALLREAHESFENGDVETLDVEDIKRRGRERLSSEPCPK